MDRTWHMRAQLGYAIRWDAADLPALPERFGALLRHPLGALESVSREALSGTRIGIYTLHFRAGRVWEYDLP